MSRRLFAALALAGVALGGCVGTTWGADLVFPIHVTRIEIEGNEHILAREVEEIMPLKVGDVLNAYTDLQPTSQAILDMGWFSEIVPDLTQDGVVTFRVVENAVLEKVEISGNTSRQDFSLFGVKLFSIRIMPSWRVRYILREHNVKVGKMLRSTDLTEGLKAVVEEYKADGYILVMIGDVKLGSTLSIEIIEGHVAGNRVSGLVTVPKDVAMAMIDLPTDQMLRQTNLNTVATRFLQSVYFSSMDFAAAAGPTRDSVILDWTLTERALLSAPAPIRAIALEGVTKFPIDVATREIGSLPDGLVDNYAVLKAVEGVFDLYMDHGFLMIRFSDARVDGDTLRLRVDEGIVSEIAFAEGTATNERVLNKVLQIGLGRVLTRNDLRVSQQRLSALGYFDDIVIDPQWADVGVRVSVSVADKTTLGGLNGSVAFDPSTGGVVGELSAKQRNVFGSGQDVSLTYKRGVSPEGEPEASTWELGYSTLAPRTEFDMISMGLYRKTEDVGGEEDDSETYLTLGGKLQFTYPVGDYSDFVIGYRHDLERKLTETEWSPVDAITLSLQEDSTDDPTFPTRGSRQSASLEKAGGFAVGREYTKLDLIWTRFWPLYGEILPGMERVLAARLNVGLGDAGLTGTESYELGGPMTIRGLDVESVQRMVVANIEHRIELIEGLTLTQFLDAGTDLGATGWGGVKATAGLEVGISVVGMLLRLDIVWSIAEDASWIPKFDFGFGPMF